MIDNQDPWGPIGDRPDCTHRCSKCGYLRFTKAFESEGPNWCRRCRYTNFDEYFGLGGINERFKPIEMKNDD